MNSLQSRLLKILRNLDSPVSPAEIRVRCQLPQSVDTIGANLRSMERMGKVREWSRGDWVHKGYRPGARRRAPTIVKKQEVEVTKNNAESIDVLNPPPPWPEAKTSGVEEKLLLMAELQKMDREDKPHQVDDAELKMMALELFIMKTPGPVGDLLQRVVDEDLRPYAPEGQAT